ncbi:MAG: hypothetical protein GX061_05680 [Eubacteriaceae bacterium]|nr:hypothetical protein [Eubacteriaceae bacterium]
MLFEELNQCFGIDLILLHGLRLTGALHGLRLTGSLRSALCGIKGWFRHGLLGSVEMMMRRLGVFALSSVLGQYTAACKVCGGVFSDFTEGSKASEA